jgi:hypothetical protein
MRCKACNIQLSDTESVRKDPQTGEYYDLCSTCYVAGEATLSDLEGSEFGEIVPTGRNLDTE